MQNLASLIHPSRTACTDVLPRQRVAHCAGGEDETQRSCARGKPRCRRRNGGGAFVEPRKQGAPAAIDAHQQQRQQRARWPGQHSCFSNQRLPIGAAGGETKEMDVVNFYRMATATSDAALPATPSKAAAAAPVANVGPSV